MVVGTALLIYGFVASSLWPIYAAIGLSVLSTLACVGGAIMLVLHFARR